jgi:transposase
METAMKRVELAHFSELPSGVLRVRSDGKRVYDEAFKAELIRQCLVPGTSTAATAMAHGINANLVRRWIVQHGARDGRSVAPPMLLPVSVRPQPSASSPAPASQAPALPQCIEIEFHGACVRLHGPVDAQSLGMVLHVLAQRRAILYSHRRWAALTRYASDGRIEIDNNAAEREIRAVAMACS